MDDSKLCKYKTAICNRMTKNGLCRYDFMCDFAHSEFELRRNLNQQCYYPVYCEKNGCREKNCMFCHNEYEMNFHPEVYKTKLCLHYATPSGCPRKSYCFGAHGKHELRVSSWSTQINQDRPQPPTNSFSALMNLDKSLNLEDSSNSANPSGESFKESVATTGTADQGQENNVFNAIDPSKIPDHMAEKLALAPAVGSMFLQNVTQFGSIVANSNNFIPSYVPGQVNVADSAVFVEECNKIKSKMLDLMDQLCGMHYERAIIENERAKTMLMQDNAKLSTMLQDLQKQQKEYLLQERRSSKQESFTDAGLVESQSASSVPRYMQMKPNNNEYSPAYSNYSYAPNSSVNADSPYSNSLVYSGDSSSRRSSFVPELMRTENPRASSSGPNNFGMMDVRSGLLVTNNNMVDQRSNFSQDQRPGANSSQMWNTGGNRPIGNSPFNTNINQQNSMSGNGNQRN